MDTFDSTDRPPLTGPVWMLVHGRPLGHRDDGFRGYSQARLLRRRYGYDGELRAVGDIRRDELDLLNRCGFNSLELPADVDLTDAQ